MGVTVRDADEGLAPRFNFNFNGLNQGVNFFFVAPLNLAQLFRKAGAHDAVMRAFGFDVRNHLLQAHSSIVLFLWVRRVVTLGTSGGGGGAGLRSSV